jgi:2-C-methyl-D-erythritol 4-phosphate cytidylyltransferase
MDITKLTRPARKALNLKLKYCGAVIVAAGNASRMGGIDKVMAPLGGEPVIVRTVRQFQNCDAIREIVVVTRPDLIVPISDLCHGFDKLKAVVVGGDSRDASVNMGLNTLSEKCKLVAVQDGARPFAGWQLIDRVVRAANSYGAAAPAIPVKDTIKVVQGGIVKETPDRSTLRAVQTPQVFDFDLLRGAMKKAKLDGLAMTDDCSAVEHMGMSVKIVEGDERNIKITTPMDLKIAELILEEMA